MIWKRTEGERKKRRHSLVWFILSCHVLGFSSSIHAVMTARTSQGSVAWAVSLNTFPYIAVPAYWVLGRSRFEGYVRARQSEDLEVQLSDEKIAAIEKFVVPVSDKDEASRAAELLADLPILRGNDVKLLIDGDATFQSILDGIDAAEEYIQNTRRW